MLHLLFLITTALSSVYAEMAVVYDYTPLQFNCFAYAPCM